MNVSVDNAATGTIFVSLEAVSPEDSQVMQDLALNPALGSFLQGVIKEGEAFHGLTLRFAPDAGHLANVKFPVNQVEDDAKRRSWIWLPGRR